MPKSSKQDEDAISWPAVAIAAVVLIALLVWAIRLFSASDVGLEATLEGSADEVEVGCTEPRAPTSRGRCCWPGQRSEGWRCVGQPSLCPPGYVVTDSGCAPETSAAFGRLHQGCAEGDGDSCHMAAVSAELGQGLEADPELALAYLDRGCRLGHLRSCTVLARYLEDAPAGDPQAVLEPLEGACRANEAKGCFELAGYLHAGVGGVPHAERAAVLYERACELGHAPGCRLAGVLQLDAPERAAPFLERGCRLADAQSCRLLESIE